MPSNKLIIAIKKNLDVLRLTEIECSIDNIVGSKPTLFIFYKCYPLFRELLFLDYLYSLIHIIISRHVINKNNMIILIFLLHGRQYRFPIPILCNIIMTQYGKTKWNLITYILIFLDIVFC